MVLTPKVVGLGEIILRTPSTAHRLNQYSINIFFSTKPWHSATQKASPLKIYGGYLDGKMCFQGQVYISWITLESMFPSVSVIFRYDFKTGRQCLEWEI